MRKNLEHPSELFLSFFLDDQLLKSSPLPPRTSQLIFEQEPDTLLLIESKNRPPFIFHLEFQSVNDNRMVDRMASYDYMLRLKHNMDVISAVIYTGNAPMNMKRYICSENNYYEYQLTDIRDMDPKLFLHSNKAEEVIMAVLTGRNDGNKELLVKRILSKLSKILPDSSSMLNEQIEIFKIFGAIRNTNIEQQIIKEEQNMPIVYDVSKTIFYQQALQKGIEQGMEKGMEQGMEKGIERGMEKGIGKGHKQGSTETIEQVVTTMLKQNLPFEKIRLYTGFSDAELKRIIKNANGAKKRRN